MGKCIVCNPKVKCHLCSKKTLFNDTLVICNKFNGNVMRICVKCGKKFKWI